MLKPEYDRMKPIPTWRVCPFCGKATMEIAAMDGICIPCWQRMERQVEALVRERDE